MIKPHITSTILTLNEEKKLQKCLDSIKSFSDEIIIVDSKSIDNTVNIAKSYKAKIFYRDFDSFSKQKNFADSKANGEWIFSIDADETATPELVKQIQEAIKSKEYDAYIIPRRNVMLGKQFKHTRWTPDKHIWLYKKSKSSWTLGVHAEVEVKGRVGELRGAKMHYHHETVADFVSMLNKYTTSEAKEYIQRGVRFSYFRLLYNPPRSFIGRFFYKKGFLDGWRGFVLSYLRAIYRLSTWVKIWEKQNV